jgi:hypothetical protein
MLETKSHRSNEAVGDDGAPAAAAARFLPNRQNIDAPRAFSTSSSLFYDRDAGGGDWKYASIDVLRS